MKNILKAIFLLLVLISPAQAHTGTAALPFLKAESGARPAALGGAYTALGNDAFSIFTNPAGTVFMDRREISLSHALWLEDMSLENLAYVQPFTSRLSILIGASALMSGSIKSYNAAGYSTGSFNAMEMALSAGVSYLISRRLYAAAQAKIFMQSSDDLSSNTYGGDFGVIYSGDYAKFGFSALNLGQKIKLGEYAYDLPRTFRFGVSRELIKDFAAGADIVNYIDSGSHLALGAEYKLSIREDGAQAIFIRAGYTSGRDKNTGTGISGGFGFMTSDLHIDYAFTPFGDLGNIHRFSLSLIFGESRENMRETYEYHYRSREENRRQTENKLFKKGKERVADIPEIETLEEYKPIGSDGKKIKDFTW